MMDHIPADDATDTESWLAARVAQYASADERAQAMFSSLSDEQLCWRPAPGKWSIAECVEHCTRVVKLQFDRVDPVLARAKTQARTGGRPPWGRGTWLGRFILGILDPARAKPKRVKAFGYAQTTGADLDPARVLAEFQAANQRLRETARRVETLDLGRIKVGSAPAGWLKMSLAQAFEVHARHHHRHLDQADRVCQAPGFPSA